MEPELRPCLREQAIEIYRSTILQAAELGAESLRRVKRQLAQCDLFFLLTHVLGRADLNRDWYFARCREVQAAPNGYLDLWAREHGKSSVITLRPSTSSHTTLQSARIASSAIIGTAAPDTPPSPGRLLVIHGHSCQLAD